MPSLARNVIQVLGFHQTTGSHLLRKILRSAIVGGICKVRALMVLLVLPVATLAYGIHDRTAFDNSFSYRSYYYSDGLVISPSELDLINSKVPIDEAHYVSPPNSLRLKWRSQTGGDWLISLKVAAADETAERSTRSCPATVALLRNKCLAA